VKRNMKRTFAQSVFLAVAIASSLYAPAQTVRPVIVEYRSSARGKFELVNNGLQPLNVVLEPRSFSIDEDGTGEFRALEPAVHLKLSAMSFRIPPQQSHWVFYEATADQLPAWFTIYSSMEAPPNGKGFTIQLDLPHTVYLVQKERLQKDDVVIKSASYDRAQHRIVIEVNNVSPRLGRVLEWQSSAKGKKISQNGFPLLPQAHRRLEAEWKWPDPPEKVALRFEHFTLKQAIRGPQE
jgi:hypothetical protein